MNDEKEYTKLEILYGYDFKRNKSEQYTEKRNFAVFSVRTEGEAVFNCEGETFSVKAGDVLYIPENTEYSQKTEGESVHALHFKGENLPGKIRVYKNHIAGDFLLDVIKQSELFINYHKMHSDFYAFIDLLETSQKQENSSYSVISEGVKYLRKNYRNHDVSVEKAAKLCNVSEVYFRKKYKEVFAISPKRFIDDMRIKYAINLLVNNTCSISEVARQCGIEDGNYFSIFFKNRVGVSPKQYKNRK